MLSFFTSIFLLFATKHAIVLFQLHYAHVINFIFIRLVKMHFFLKFYFIQNRQKSLLFKRHEEGNP